jgi:hypothetical protein
LKKANRGSYILEEKKILEEYANKLKMKVNHNFIKGMKNENDK